MFKGIFVIVLVISNIIQIYSAPPSTNQVQQFVDYDYVDPIHEPAHAFGDVKEIIQRINYLLRDVTGVVAQASKNLSHTLINILETLTNGVNTVFSGVLGVVKHTIQAQKNLILKFSDALLTPMLTNANRALDKLLLDLTNAMNEITNKFEEALEDVEEDANNVLRESNKTLQEQVDTAKSVITSIIQSEFANNDDVQECLQDQLEVVQMLADKVAYSRSRCVEDNLDRAKELLSNLPEMFDDRFDEIQQLMSELDLCTRPLDLPDRPSFSEKRRAAKCLAKVTIKIELASFSLPKLMSQEVGVALRSMTDLKLDLDECAFTKWAEMEAALSMVSENVSNCITEERHPWSPVQY